jgi:hypothetical protein
MTENFLLGLADLLRVFLHLGALFYITYLVRKIKGKWFDGFWWLQVAFFLLAIRWVEELAEHCCDVPAWIQIVGQEVFTTAGIICIVAAVRKMCVQTQKFTSQGSGMEELRAITKRLFP